MNILQGIKRGLRDARGVISNPDKYEPRTINLAWAVIKSQAKRGIFVHPLPYQQTCKAYEPDEHNKPSYQVES